MSACVKCAAVLDAAALACRRCGLVVANAEAFAARTHAEVPAALLAAWAAALERWDDGERHLDVVHQAALANQLAWASRQYRQAGQSRPGDRWVTEMHGRLATMAETVALVGDRGAALRAKKRARTIAIVIGAVLVAMLLGAVLVYRSFSDHMEPNRRAPPPSWAPDFGRPVPGPARGP